MSDTSIPSDLHYTKEHEWARREGELVVVGITAHAVGQLGDITMVSLPAVGTRVAAGGSFGDVDSVKAVSELFSPCEGEVVEVNATLDGAPEQVNEDPYGRGWMLKLRPASPTAIDGLMDAEAYARYLETA